MGPAFHREKDAVGAFGVDADVVSSRRDELGS